MPDATTHKPLDKPKKGEHRRRKKSMRAAVLRRFRERVMDSDGDWGCCNALGTPPHATLNRPPGRNYYEAAHIVGRGRVFSNKPSNGIKLCWWCHDAVDGRHNEMWPELTPDERKVKILDWWEEHRPEHYKMRGWKESHDNLRASVARRQASVVRTRG